MSSPRNDTTSRPEDAERIVPKARMVEPTLAGGGRDVADPAIEVFVDDVSGDIACARTACADFVEYLR
jgi:hypothetical protein